MQDIAHVISAFDHYLLVALPSPHERENDPEAADDLAALGRSLDELTALLRVADVHALEVFDRLQQAHPARIRDASIHSTRR